MQISVLDAIILLATVVGGALGAYLASVPVWKGGIISGLALIVMLAIVIVAGIEQWILESLIYLLAVGLIGGRFAMKLTTRQLASVVLGSFLIPLVTAVVAIYVLGLT